jgi:hypothetical protein
MDLPTFARTLARSITPATGALVGGLGTATPILASVTAEMMFGRPSSTSVIAFPFALIYGVGGAAVGGIIGFIVRLAWRRTKWAGPIDRRIVAAAVMLVITVPTALAIRSVLADEAFNAPRVIVSNAHVVRSDGRSVLNPVTPATLVWASLPDDAPHVKEISWNGHTVRVGMDGDRMLVKAGDVAATPIDISRLDYVREVYGVTATGIEGRSEWLALLVRLRATGRRELLVIFDPVGTLAYEELIERRTGLTDNTVLWSAGPKNQRHDIVVDLGSPIRYALGQ